ncbi:MAG TPA: iron-containing redox enzyme family protein [Polyangiales bacterium]|nr:iron-containing redox enzyme family protein [Polyangiales bacterium]
MKNVLDECLAELGRCLETFPWQEREAYADWLAQTYFYVRHSTRLLAASAARFALDERGNGFHYRFGAHLSEEKKHELLALHDMKVLGCSLADFPERHATRMFYEPQYFKIEHQEPLALFGYILPLEGISVSKGPWILERVRGAYGDRPTAFLKVHVNDDEDHLAKAFAVLETISDEQRALVEQNLHQTTAAYCGLLADIQQRKPALRSALRVPSPPRADAHS